MIINGTINLSNSSIVSLGNVKEINGKLDLSWSQNIKSLGKLKTVNRQRFNSLGILMLSNCPQLNSLGDLEFVYHTLFLVNCKNLKDLGKLTFAYKIYLGGSGITEDYVKKEKPKLFENCNWN